MNATGVILHMAMSLDGMMARENDDTDFLSHDHWDIFVALARRAGATIWGRRTHELVRGYGPQFLADLDGVGLVVVSGNPQLALEPGWRAAASPAQAVALLTEAGHTHALLVGGAALNTAFAVAGLIDEVIITVEPVIVGRGIPLVPPATLDLRLGLVGVTRVREQLVQLHYRVLR